MQSIRPCPPFGHGFPNVYVDALVCELADVPCEARAGGVFVSCLGRVAGSRMGSLESFPFEAPSVTPDKPGNLPRWKEGVEPSGDGVEVIHRRRPEF